jgi:hypothetical protein
VTKIVRRASVFGQIEESNGKPETLSLCFLYRRVYKPVEGIETHQML